jgi:hypothetical protein
MKLGIMQPYFLPYIGYFQLIAAVDVFILYDNIKYTKKGWINRNRMLLNSEPCMFSVNLKRGSDSSHIVQRELANEFNKNKLLNQFKGAYSKAPYFNKTFQLLEKIVSFDEENLFKYIHHSLLEICSHLCIETEIKVSSELAINHDLKAQDKVIALCDYCKANTYINSIGGTGLYNKDEFRKRGITLQFIKAKPFEYAQLAGPFVPWLSIVDVLMFNSVEATRLAVLGNIELIEC